MQRMISTSCVTSNDEASFDTCYSQFVNIIEIERAVLIWNLATTLGTFCTHKWFWLPNFTDFFQFLHEEVIFDWFKWTLCAISWNQMDYFNWIQWGIMSVTLSSLKLLNISYYNGNKSEIIGCLPAWKSNEARILRDRSELAGMGNPYMKNCGNGCTVS